jgi:hypothetical protein
MNSERTENNVQFEGWCILEIMGHRKLGGYLKEANIAGASFIRFDTFNETGVVAATQFYNPASIYCITPTTQEIAIAFGLRNQPAPVQKWELKPIPEPVVIVPFADEDFFEPE